MIYKSSISTDDGKPFTNIDEALQYLYNALFHAKTHLNAKLIDMEVQENSFIITTEETNFFGKMMVKRGINGIDDPIKIKKYLEINGIYS